MALTNISEQKSAIPEAPVTPSAVVNGGRSLSRPQVNSRRVRIENFNNEATLVQNPKPPSAIATGGYMKPTAVAHVANAKSHMITAGEKRNCWFIRLTSTP